MRSWSFVAAVGIGVLAQAGAAKAELLWSGDFESGDLSQWNDRLNESTGTRKNITVVTDPVVDGSRAARIDIHPDDLWSNGHNRVELKHSLRFTAEGESSFFAWSFRLAEPTRVHDDIAYFETQDTWQQSLAFYVDPDPAGAKLGFRMTVGPGEIWSKAITAGAWHRVAVQIVWSVDPTIGQVSIWLDGEKVVDAAKGRTKPDAKPLFTQIGFHRNSPAEPVETIYVDAAKEGTTLEDVLAAGNAEASSDDDDGGGCRMSRARGDLAALLAAVLAGAALVRRDVTRRRRR